METEEPVDTAVLVCSQMAENILWKYLGANGSRRLL